MKMTKTFQVGETYATRSICDHDCIHSFKIIARTAKSVTVNVHGVPCRRSLSVYEGVEQFKPFGTYSMCAVIGADKTLAMVEGGEVMRTVPERHRKEFFAAQKRVAELLKPYLGRVVNQYFGDNSIIETFLVCSKEADAGTPDDKRHMWRGIITVYYGFGVARGDDAHIQFSYSEELVQAALGLPNNGSWEDTAEVLAKLVPALPVGD